MAEDYEKDLTSGRKVTKVALGRYLKNTEKTLSTAVDDGLDENLDND